jgi:PhnB protein
MVKPIPDEYPRVITYLCVDGAAEAIDFYTSILGFTERHRMVFDGRIGHCELELGDSVLMLSDEYPEMGVIGPKTLGGTPTSVNVYVEDSDATFAAAVAAGASALRPVEDQFYGDRSGQFEDPWGHRWGVATHIEDVDDDEIARRAAEMMSGSEH